MTTRIDAQGARRSITVPTRLQRAPSARLDLSPATEDKAETLYVHPAAKVVSFAAASNSVRSPSSVEKRQAQNAEGTLPWASRSERVVAVGPLRLYRLPGSVSFLHSGNLLLSLLPRTQCWCVDGVSKFALRSQNVIYRIELPTGDDPAMERVEEMKTVLGMVIQYEKTPCPFKRGFHVEYPEEQRRMLPRRQSQDPQVKARKWAFEDVWRPEGGARSPVTPENGSDAEYESGGERDYDADSLITNPSSYATHPGIITATNLPARARATEGNRSVSAPLHSFHRPTVSDAAPALREVSEEVTSTDEAYAVISVAEPAELSNHTADPITNNIVSPSLPNISPSDENLASSKPPNTPPPAASPLISSPEPVARNPFGHDGSSVSSSQTSDTPPRQLAPQPHSLIDGHPSHGTSKAQSLHETSPTSTPSPPPPPPPPHGSASTETIEENPSSLPPPPPQGQPNPQPLSPPNAAQQPLPIISGPYAHRRTAQLTPTRTSSPDAEPSHLLSSAFNILLSPPRDLLSLMLAFAARLATGVLRAPAVYRFLSLAALGKGYGARLPGRWVDSDGEEDGWDGDSELEGDEEREEGHLAGGGVHAGGGEESEDDYGVPIGNDSPARRRRTQWGNGVAAEEDVE